MTRLNVKHFLCCTVAVLATSLLGSDAFTADWIDEDQPDVAQSEIAADDDAFRPKLDDLEDDSYPEDEHEIAFDLEDDSLSDLQEDETEADPASYRPGDRDEKRRDKKRGDKKRGDKKRGDKKDGDRKHGDRRDHHRFEKKDGDREYGGARGDCPFCRERMSGSPRQAFRERGPHGPGHSPRGYGGPGPHDFQRGARMVIGRLTRLEHKVDMLLRMTHRAHVTHARSGSLERGWSHRGGSAQDGERAHRGRDHSRRDHGKARDAGSRRRQHHERDHDGPPSRRRARPHHRPAEWDAPPQDSSDGEDHDRSASLEHAMDWDDQEWDDSYEADQPIDSPRRESISVTESLQRLERYFDDLLHADDEQARE